MAPKAKAKAGVRLRPAARLRRPAVAVPPAGRVDTTKLLGDLDLSGLQKLGFIVLKEASYYGRSVAVCGQVTGVRMVDRQVFLELKATGTQDDALLRALTGKPSRKMEVHVCDAGCQNSLENELLVHGRKYEEADKRTEDWYTNVEQVVPLDEGPDELAALRTAAREPEVAPKPKRARKEAEEGETGDAPREAKKRGKKPEEVEDEEELGKKTQAALFAGTGLDPEVRQRLAFLRRARKLGKSKKKKKKKKDSGSESSSDSSSSSSEGSAIPGGLFQSEKRIKTLWRRYPGALTAHSLKEARERLLTATGAVWEADQKAVVPLFVYYARQNLMAGMSAPMSQETLTVSMALDLMVQGKAAAACDVLSQRLKALETISRGGHWTIARQLELCRIDDGGIANEEESRAAAREAREEDKVKAMVTKPSGARPGDGGSYGGKGKKGKDTKSAGKGKSNDGGRGKGEGRKDDSSQGWQGQKK